MLILYCSGCSGASIELPAVSIDVDGQSRSYHIFVPANTSTSAPVLLAFHGGGGAGIEFPQQREFETLASENGFILVLPQAVLVDGNEGEWQLNTTSEREQDIRYVRKIIEDISMNHDVNASKIYGIGYSLGSMFTYELACQMSDELTALASFAGTMPVNVASCNQPRNIPIMHIHGTEDGIISYQDSWDWKSWSEVGPMRNIPDLLTYWSTKYNCQEESQSSEGTADHFVYSNCSGDGHLEHYRLDGQGHGWPDTIGSQTTARTVWNFLNRY
ncbi:MAG: dienelactone hydrolase family protein [Myxococcota bacterium]|nr:dienelactone hydrolase family protein [Myxococcota bacterium]